MTSVAPATGNFGVRRLVFAAALLAALFHIAPVWRATLVTPAGWQFTNNVTVSPDYMQYRVWARQAAEMGPLVDDRFTTEPNRPHIFVPFYWFVGKTARWLGTTPERVYAYLGMPLAFALTVLLWVGVRRYVPHERQAWWVFLAILFGGGLGAYLKIAAELPGLRDWYPFQRVVSEPLLEHPVFEDYRSHYLVKTLLDTHFLLIWIVALAAVLMFVEAARRPSVPRAVGASLLFAAATALHIYEGVTLLAIAVAVTACVWSVLPNRRAAAGVLGAVGAAALIPLALLYTLFARSGLPLPAWRALPILPLTLLLAYPLAWGLLALGGRDLWRRGGFDQRALMGWALGCTVVTLSAPFYPYPDRGTMTMQVPLMILAGLIAFARWERLTRRAAVIAVLLLGATPVWLVARTWRSTSFRPTAPFAFVDAGHRRIIDTLTAVAGRDDILAAEGFDLLWLAPEYRGRLHAGHFFLTVDYDRKVRELEVFLTDTLSGRRMDFLRRTGTRFFFVAAPRHPESFARLPDVTTLVRGEAGWLFEYRAAAAGVP